MTERPHPNRARKVLALLLAGVAMAGPALAGPAWAQDAPDARIRKLEAEVRALQRKVFPGAGGTGSFEPEITRPAAPTSVPGQPQTTAVSDLLTRMDALEGQMARLTGQIEQNTNRIGQIEARIGTSGDAGPIPPVGATVIPSPAQTSPQASGAAPQPAQVRPPATSVTATSPGAAGPTAQRLATVEGIERPQSADAGDDAYSYGYRLWDAKLYPEAEQQLKVFVQTYPRHARISYGRNLLGRAYLDEGNPREAAKWFLQNYQADKAGPRASDSLLFLAASMKRLDDPKRACIALAEFGSTYAAEAAGRLKADYDGVRSGLTCN